ncbi:hypothetical protein GCM10010218_42800 [Streptomyces mashuensis]|uniref:Outer membrane lipoprotein carrier protein LolA n=1 Tax=Streptomyces mashuensis TaxID=33904 RepID=A0A919EET5_9ACTN|nr:outer membrane lipoprotein carrier protein LolA [Streptomyces mashuensis]GHF56881.1 hypothetical protein GCM10010218_42800 [Streptomyces mashuensis]
MARIHQPNPGAEGAEGAEGAAGTDAPGRGTGRRKAVRYAVPVAVAGVAAATIGIGSALAKSADPDLPRISAQDLVAKMAASDTQRISGSVKISTDLGLPSMPSGFSLEGMGEGKSGGKGDKGAKGDGSAASPESKLTELVSGTHTLRVAADGPDRQRLSVVERAAEYTVVHNGADVWAYDSASNTVHHSRNAEHAAGRQQAEPRDLSKATPQQLAKQALDAAGKTTDVSVDGTAKVAGRDAYQLVIKPKQQESTVGAVRIAVDAKTGVPLKFTLSAKSGGKAVVDAGFTSVDFGKPAAGAFTFTPPKGAKVTEGEPGGPARDGHGKDGHGKDGDQPLGKGLGALGLPGGGTDSSGTRVTGEGWASIVELKGADPAKSAKGAKAGEKKGANDKNAEAVLDSFGSKVSGDFGTGRLFSTRIVNALMTDDGRVLVGAVSKDALVKAANAAHSGK